MGLVKRLSDALSALLGKPTEEVLNTRDEMLSLNRELAEAKLELAESRENLAAYRKKIEEMEVAAPLGMGDPLESVFHDLASFLSQLRMQASLMDAGREISGNSVMVLAKQVLDVVEKAGLEPIAAFGKEVPFDAQTCEPLAADISFLPGEPVVVRFVGYRYKGRIVRRALVERTH
jgi:molecular chaperone GrpE (heat shock protein)